MNAKLQEWEITMVHRLQSQIRAKGIAPIRIQIWDDAITYANALLCQKEELDRATRLNNSCF